MSAPIFYKPSLKKRLLWVLIVVIMALAVLSLAYLIINNIKNPKERTTPVVDSPSVSSGEFSLDPGIQYKHALSQTALFFYSTENVKVANTNGHLKEDLSLKMSQPSVSISGNFSLFYDEGGRNMILFNGTRQARSVSSEAKIILASVNNSGSILLVTEGNLHKCVVSVFSPSGEELFKWNSGGLSVVSADISDNNKEITVSALNTDESKIKNSIIMFDITKEKPFTNDSFEDDIYSVVKYSGNTTYCLGTGGAILYNHYGKSAGTIDYNQRELLSYDLDDESLVLLFSGSMESSGVMEIKSYDKRGEEIGSFTSDQAIDFMDCKNNTILINNGKTLTVLNNRCREKYKTIMEIDLKDFSFFGDNKHGIGITATGAEYITLK